MGVQKKEKILIRNESASDLTNKILYVYILSSFLMYKVIASDLMEHGWNGETDHYGSIRSDPSLRSIRVLFRGDYR